MTDELETFENLVSRIVSAMREGRPVEIKYSPKIAPAFEAALNILRKELQRRENVRRARQK